MCWANQKVNQIKACELEYLFKKDTMYLSVRHNPCSYWKCICLDFLRFSLMAKFEVLPGQGVNLLKACSARKSKAHLHIYLFSKANVSPSTQGSMYHGICMWGCVQTPSLSLLWIFCNTWPLYCKGTASSVLNVHPYPHMNNTKIIQCAIICEEKCWSTTRVWYVSYNWQLYPKRCKWKR